VNLQITAPIDELPAVTTEDALARVLRRSKIGNEIELLQALDLRRQQIGMANSTLEERAGLCAGFATKLLGPAKRRSPTLSTVDKLMTALGMSWILVVDPEKTVGRPSFKRRNESQVRRRKVSSITLQRARPAIMAELMRRAARRKWAGVDARAFLRAMLPP
jgi:hypothetical protein